MSLTMSDSPFINQMVNKFYEYMGSVFLEYYQLPEKPIIRVEQSTNVEDLKTKADVEIVVEPVPETDPVQVPLPDPNPVPVAETREQTFPEFFLYKLYYNYGIKRRTVNEHIALLFYDKNLKGYKSAEYITMLCRHMMIDLRNMRIVSLGIPKAMKLDVFCEALLINKEDATSNITQDGQAKYQVFKFPEGTMITYNPSLAKYNVEPTTETSQLDTIEGSNAGMEDAQELAHAELINQNIAKLFAQQEIQYSTRKVVGTGRFSSLKTFLEMFNENNEIANTNLGQIPAEYMANKVMVFNIEHNENHVISMQIRNYNTLCAVYQFKTENEVSEEYQALLALVSNGSISISTGALDDDNIKLIKDAFTHLGTGMITQCNLKEVREQMEQFGVKLHFPESITSFSNIRTKPDANPDANPEAKPVESKNFSTDELTIEQLENIIQNRPRDFQGYIIYAINGAINGARTKIMNTKYKELKILKGNKPIVIEQWNTKNLFYLYWRLMKIQLIPQFIAEFDMTGGWSYNQIFYWFASLAHGYSVNLFRVYHNSFVKRSMDKYNIPYSMKPMCGDLHNMYKANKVPITQSMVEQYIFSQNVGKIFWRLFSGK